MTRRGSPAIDRTDSAVDVEFDGYCLKCRYPLKGLPELRCPECGLPFDPNNPKTYWNHSTAAPSRRSLIALGLLSGFLSGLPPLVFIAFWVLPGVLFGVLVVARVAIRLQARSASIVGAVVASIAAYYVAILTLFNAPVVGPKNSILTSTVACGLAGFVGTTIICIGLIHLLAKRDRVTVISSVVMAGTVGGLVFPVVTALVRFSGFAAFGVSNDAFVYLSGFIVWQGSVAAALSRAGYTLDEPGISR